MKNKTLQQLRPNSETMFLEVSQNSQTVTRSNASRLTTVAVLLILGGCSAKLSKLPEEPKIDIPEQWQPVELSIPAQPETKPLAIPNPVEPEPDKPVQNGWLNNFADPQLANHVDTALQNNPDLWTSATELKSAIEQVTITGSQLWPNVSASIDRSATDSKDNGITTEIRTVTGTVSIGWEADIWGKLSQEKKAAAYSAQAQAELYNAAELSLVANVTRAWFNLITNKLQLDLAQQRLDSFQNTAKLIEENYERGLRSALDVYLSRTDVQRNISALSDEKFNYITSLRAFKTLLGEYPDIAMEFDAKLPTLSGPVPTGLPAELLTRRPDVKASQLIYKARIANAKAAKRDRYPSISFSGTIGDSRDSFNKLFESDNMVTTLISGITQPIFQAGALRSLEEQAYLDAESAYASLVRTTLSAFEEVENSLSRESLLQEQHIAINEAVKLAQGGLDLALDRYQSGIENYTTVLESQRSLFIDKSNEINLRNALLQNRIDIHLALGGDFATEATREDMTELPSPVPTEHAEPSANVEEPSAKGEEPSAKAQKPSTEVQESSIEIEEPLDEIAIASAKAIAPSIDIEKPLEELKESAVEAFDTIPVE